MDGHITNATNIKYMIIRDSDALTLIIRRVKIDEPMSLISHVLSITGINTPGRSIGDRGIGDIGLHTINFTQHRFRRNGGRRKRTGGKICLIPLANLIMLFVFRRVPSRRWTFVPLRRH
jgi:hypothetical protein